MHVNSIIVSELSQLLTNCSMFIWPKMLSDASNHRGSTAIRGSTLYENYDEAHDLEFCKLSCMCACHHDMHSQYIHFSLSGDVMWIWGQNYG